MIIRIKGFKVFKDRHGKVRCYHRATGVKVDLETFEIGSEELALECARIQANTKSPEAKPGTLGMLIKEYKKSPQWAKLKPKTQKWYESAMLYLKPVYDAALVSFDSAVIIRIRDKAEEKKGWYFANQTKTTLGTVFAWGLERKLSGNPTIGIKRIKRPKDLERANRPWKPEECSAVLIAAPAHLRAAIATILFTGADPVDAIQLLKSKYKSGTIDFSRQKTGNPVLKAAPQVLINILNETAHDAITLLANSYGRPWTRSGLDTIWNRLKLKLENNGDIGKGLTLKGLRHTHATILREQGKSYATIANSLGDKTEQMGRHYSRDADTKNDMLQVTEAMDNALEYVKPSAKSVKP